MTWVSCVSHYQYQLYFLSLTRLNNCSWDKDPNMPNRNVLCISNISYGCNTLFFQWEFCIIHWGIFCINLYFLQYIIETDLHLHRSFFIIWILRSSDFRGTAFYNPSNTYILFLVFLCILGNQNQSDLLQTTKLDRDILFLGNIYNLCLHQ